MRKDLVFDIVVVVYDLFEIKSHDRIYVLLTCDLRSYPEET